MQSCVFIASSIAESYNRVGIRRSQRQENVQYSCLEDLYNRSIVVTNDSVLTEILTALDCNEEFAVKSLQQAGQNKLDAREKVYPSGSSSDFDLCTCS